jgi:hypothetical protein
MKCGQNHPNKLTSEIKERLQSVIESTMESIRIDDMNTNQKLKLLQLGLQYIIPKLTSTTIHEEDSCIDEPIFIEVLKRKEDSDEEEWADNFEVSSRHEVPRLKVK